jgi:hypothetical protein
MAKFSTLISIGLSVILTAAALEGGQSGGEAHAICAEDQQKALRMCQGILSGGDVVPHDQRRHQIYEALDVCPDCGLAYALLGCTLDVYDFVMIFPPSDRGVINNPDIPIGQSWGGGWLDCKDCWIKAIELCPEHFLAYEALGNFMFTYRPHESCMISGKAWKANELRERAAYLKKYVIVSP